MKPLLVLFFLSTLYINTSSAQETGPTYIERELDYLMSIWPGDYDNQEQISFDARAAQNQPAKEGRFHASVVLANANSIGENILYIEISKHGDLNNIYQQRIYKLTSDEDKKAIRVSSYALKKSLNYLNATRQEDAFQAMRKKDLIKLSGCDILLRRNEDNFEGANDADNCVEGNKQEYLTQYLNVSKDKYSFLDRRFSKAENQPLSDIVTPRQMRRARWFACMVDVPKNKPGVSNFTQHYIKIHDQGGEFTFVHPDGRELTLLMRNTWSYGMQRETFFIGIFEDGADGKLVVYSWGTPGADRIGMNPGYVRIQCDLDTPRNVELQHGLRVDS